MAALEDLGLAGDPEVEAVPRRPCLQLRLPGLRQGWLQHMLLTAITSQAKVRYKSFLFHIFNNKFSRGKKLASSIWHSTNIFILRCVHLLSFSSLAPEITSLFKDFVELFLGHNPEQILFKHVRMCPEIKQISYYKDKYLLQKMYFLHEINPYLIA